MSSAPATALLTLILSAALLQAAAADPSGLAAADEPASREYVAAIDKDNALDPQSPETINTRLGYADFLAKAAGGACGIRLDRAQEQLEFARKTPVIGIAIPSGLAHASDVEYQILFARASCPRPGSTREQELRAAIAAAERSTGLYRESLDAVSMATMQFNAAVAYHALGDTAAAITALQTAIDMDREYGFEDDAADNYQMLLQWNNQEAGPQQVEALMRDFPQRSVTLSFGWAEGDSNVQLAVDYSQLASGEVLRYRGTRNAQRQVRKGLISWAVSYNEADPRFDFTGVPNTDSRVQGFGISLSRMLLQFHDFSVAHSGDFNDSEHNFRFAKRVRADAKALGHGPVSRGDVAKQLVRSIGDETSMLQKFDGLIAEDYNLGTGTWIGSTLEQGVWYEMEAPLSLTIAPQIALTHKIEFAFTRQVPCTTESVELKCVEIVLRARPDAAALQSILGRVSQELHLPRSQSPQLWSLTYMRLVTDPGSLQPYSREIRRHVYWAISAARPNDSLIESEKTVLEIRYDGQR
jgi:tetratricopeptide (TPR) repeat protein